MEILKRVFTSEIKGIDEKEGTLTAYISTGGVDRMSEVLDPAGADMSNYKKNPVVLWAHDYSLPPIGKALWVKKDGEGILSKVKFASTEFAQEIFQLYKEGFMKAFSVGFIPKETQEHDVKESDRGKKPYRTFRKWELLEYSAVPVPANPEALSLAMQKGIVKKGFAEKYFPNQQVTEPQTDNEKDDWGDEKGIIKEPVAPGCPTTNDVKQELPALAELMAENKLLQEQVEAFKKEVTALNYKIYQMLQEKQKVTSPGITSDEIAAKVRDEVAGVIRRLQGKVD